MSVGDKDSATAHCSLQLDTGDDLQGTVVEGGGTSIAEVTGSFADDAWHFGAVSLTATDIDVYVAPSWVGNNLALTNLSGHPTVVVPNGFNDKNEPTSITFTGRLFGDAETMLVAKAYQDATAFHTKHPAL